MSGLIKWILAPGAGAEGGHPSPEDLARLADGLVDQVERAGLIRHLNRCSECYEILSQTLVWREEEAARPVRRSWWRSYALAASLAVVLAGYGLYFHGPWSGPEAPPAPQSVLKADSGAALREGLVRTDQAEQREPAADLQAGPEQPKMPGSPELEEAGPVPSPRPAPQGLVTVEVAGGRTEAREQAGEGAASRTGPKLRAMAPSPQGTGVAARLPLNEALASLLEVGRAAGWRDKALVRQLEDLLRAMGVRVTGVEKVILAGAAAMPRTGREVVIRQEGKALHLTIIAGKD